MALTENRIASTADDTAAIAELHEIVDRQRAAFLADPFPTLEQRLELLGALAGMLIGHREQIQEAMSSDFAVHPTVASDMIEILGVAGPRRLRRREPGRVDGARAAPRRPGLLRLRARVRAAAAQGRDRQHRPLELPVRSVGRAAGRDARRGQPGRDQAVGVRARLRTAAAGHGPRDVRSRSGRRRRRRAGAGAGVLARALGPPALHRQPEHRPRDRQGGGRAARAGDARARRQVPGDPDRRQRRRRVGQAGARHEVAQERPDVHQRRLLPRPARSGRGVREPRRAAVRRRDARVLLDTGLHRDHQRAPPGADRAPARGGPRRRRRDPPTGQGRGRRRPTRDSFRCRSSSTRRPIFRSCATRSSARSCRSCPTTTSTRRSPTSTPASGRSACTCSPRTSRSPTDVLARTTSGGACVNAAAVHGALPSLPFGGIGQSGTGRHHGVEGFREFSNLRAVFVRGEGDLIEAFMPPYGETAQAVVNAAFAGGE